MALRFSDNTATYFTHIRHKKSKQHSTEASIPIPGKGSLRQVKIEKIFFIKYVRKIIAISAF